MHFPDLVLSHSSSNPAKILICPLGALRGKLEMQIQVKQVQVPVSVHNCPSITLRCICGTHICTSA